MLAMIFSKLGNLHPFKQVSLIYVLLTIVALAMVSQLKPEVKVEEKLVIDYCEMVDIYKATNGEFGWPDFKQAYSEHCGK